MSIQYGGAHVQGSPFTVRVSGAPDPTRVKVYGPGVEHGVLAMYQSRFICDTRGAGAGQLTVRIRGPKGKLNNTQIRTFTNLVKKGFSIINTKPKLLLYLIHRCIPR